MSKSDSHARAEISEVPEMKPGQQTSEFEHVQEFLKRFGYLPDVPNPGLFDEPTQEALTQFQKFSSIDSTGTFNASTRQQMAKPRCGMPDPQQSDVGFNDNCAWGIRTLTYAFDTGTPDVAGGLEWDAIRRAFRTWEDVGGLTFVEVDVNANPDIAVGWREADDPDHSMVGGILAHAAFPPDCDWVTDGLPKPVHFDDEEHTWVIGAERDSHDIESVALHEIGHIVGLAHSDVAGAVMQPSIAANSTKRSLTQDDIDGFRKLYPVDRWVDVGVNDPVWSDRMGWSDKTNYETIQAVGVGNNLYLLARSNRGMITLRYDVGGDRWVDVGVNDPVWSDRMGWSDKTNYETIQAVGVGNNLYLLARSNRGMITLRLDRSTR